MLTETRLHPLPILQSSLQTTQRQEHCRMFCQMGEDTQTGMLQNWGHLIIPYTFPSAQSPLLVKAQLKLWNSQLLYSQICLAWLQQEKNYACLKKQKQTKNKNMISHYPISPSFISKHETMWAKIMLTQLVSTWYIYIPCPLHYHPSSTLLYQILKIIVFVWFACLFCLCLCLFDFWVRFLLSLASLEQTTYKAQVGLHFWQPSCLSLLKCLDYKCVPVQSTLTFFFLKMFQNKLNLSFWKHTLKTHLPLSTYLSAE